MTATDLSPAVARLLLALGVAVLSALWLGPLPDMSRTAFSAHMLLHLGVVSVAAPLISIGLAGLGFAARALPAAAISGLLALAIDLVIVWGWHAPALHDAAARNTWVFAAQQASFVLAGLVVWGTSFRDTSRRSRALGVFAMFLTFMHMAMLGILLALSPSLLYAADLCLGAFGFSGLEDQQLGGVLMATLGGLPHLVAGIFLASRVLLDEHDQVPDQRLERPS